MIWPMFSTYGLPTSHSPKTTVKTLFHIRDKELQSSEDIICEVNSRNETVIGAAPVTIATSAVHAIVQAVINRSYCSLPTSICDCMGYP